MVKYFVFLSFIFSNCCQVFSQQQFTFKGQLKSATDGSSLSNVNIYVEGENVGVISNEYGFFEIHVPFNSNVCFSYLGYETYKAKVNATKTNQVILLKPYTFVFKELVVKRGKTNLKTIIEKAIENLDKEFIDTSYCYQAYYSERITKDDEEVRFLEAAINVYDKKPNQKAFIKGSNEKVVINGLNKVEKGYRGNLVNGNNLDLLLSFGKIYPLIRRYKTEKLVLDTIEYYKEREVYVILGYFKNHIRSKYYIYHDDNSFMKVQNINKGSKKEVSLPGRKSESIAIHRIFTEVLLEKINQHSYPKYINYNLITSHKDKYGNYSEISVTSKLLINDFLTLTELPSEQFMDTKTDLWDQKPTQNPFDWDSYNSVIK